MGLTSDLCLFSLQRILPLVAPCICWIYLIGWLVLWHIFSYLFIQKMLLLFLIVQYCFAAFFSLTFKINKIIMLVSHDDLNTISGSFSPWMISLCCVSGNVYTGTVDGKLWRIGPDDSLTLITHMGQNLPECGLCFTLNFCFLFLVSCPVFSQRGLHPSFVLTQQV